MLAPALQKMPMLDCKWSQHVAKEINMGSHFHIALRGICIGCATITRDASQGGDRGTGIGGAST